MNHRRIRLTGRRQQTNGLQQGSTCQRNNAASKAPHRPGRSKELDKHWAAGPEGGLWHSTDGGDTWTEITRNPGLPDGVVIKVGSMDNPEQYPGPQMAIFCMDKQTFHRVPEGVPEYERFPG